MSPDDIFAAQMWPWPDPALKRDAMGRVLFVNAAFLQMYGGQIDDWRGNVITGWPTPQAPGLPYRFETRLPSDDGELVYDWMEFTMADGNAFAMARNVTYLFIAPDPDPGTESEPAILAVQAAEMPAPPADIAPPAQAPALAPALPAFAEAPAPVQTAPVQAAEPAATDPAFDSASYSELVTPEATAPASAPAAEVPPAPETPQAPVTETRDFERRALPLEDDSAVLGNNWRDAVIAKAVGADAPQQDSQAETTGEAPEAASSADAVGPMRILLAEDNAINALLTRTLLEAEGHTVDTVEDGVLAVEAVKNAAYDLIFMDMRMPNMDGLEATRKIRAMDTVSKGLPIIALTANAFDDDRNACFDSGMNDFMTKPVSAEELSEMVRTWTQNKDKQNAA